MICERCGQDIPPGIIHEPSLKVGGHEFDGPPRCRWMTVDDKGKTWRDYARE